MAPTNSGTANGDITPRFDLGGHKNFMESAKALIQNTNTRLERMKTISNELRYLADQIKDDRDDKNLSPDATPGGNMNNKTVTLDKKPQIKIIIQSDEQKVRKSAKAKKNKITLKSNNNYSNKVTDKKLSTRTNDGASKDAALSTDHKQATSTSMANLSRKELMQKEKKLLEDENDYNPVKNIERDDNLIYQRHCCSFHKLKVCRGMDHGELKQQWYNGLDHRKILEKLRGKRLTRSTPTPLKTSIVDLPRRLHSECCTRGDIYQLLNSIDCHLNEKQKYHTSFSKINNSTEHGQKRQIQRNVLLPKKITLQDNGISDTFRTESIKSFDIPVRFRLCKSSKELLTNTKTFL